MIYTVTTNPSLDYYMSFDGPVKSGEHNRSTKEFFDAGGKGVNVSIFLNNLGIQSACLGFLGGFTKEYYLESFKKYPYIQPLFTNIKDNTRINIKALDGVSTSLNAMGPHISDEEYNKFITRASRIYDDDYLVLSGRVQNELWDKIIKLVADLARNDVKVIFDTDTPLVEACLDHMPYAVKLNSYTVGVNEEEIVNKAKDYITRGANYVLYSSPVNPNYYLFYDGGALKATRENAITDAIGTGDAMLAGFIFSTMRGANPKEAFRYAVVCSKRLTLNDNQADRKVINDEVDGLEVIDL